MMFNRKVGMEMEGYVTTHPNSLSLYRAEAGYDGSLYHSGWYDDYDYEGEIFGVEIQTEPSKDIEDFVTTFSDLQDIYGWSVDTQAGTHVHVDISDFTLHDIVKLFRFCKGIERIIFMFVQDYRYDNRYCQPLSKEWRKIFWRSSTVNLDELVNQPDFSNFVSYARRVARLQNHKYNWLNVFDSQYRTAEFRLFNAVRTEDEVKNFATLAHNIVELVKNSTVEHLQFIIRSLYNVSSVEECVAKFFEVLNMNPMPIEGLEAKSYLESKFAGQEVAQAI